MTVEAVYDRVQGYICLWVPVASKPDGFDCKAIVWNFILPRTWIEFDRFFITGKKRATMVTAFYSGLHVLQSRFAMGWGPSSPAGLSPKSPKTTLIIGSIKQERCRVRAISWHPAGSETKGANGDGLSALLREQAVNERENRTVGIQ